MTDTPKQLVNEQEIAKMFGFSVKTLQAWRWKRIGPPFIRQFRSVRYDPDEVAAYFAEKRVQHGS